MTTQLRNLVLLALMLASAGLAIAMRPTQKIADIGPRINLETAFPKQFGSWKIDTTLVPITVAPDVQVKLDAIYDQTLSRTYKNSDGQLVMLSVAYGGDQSSDKSQVHRPEFCYAAQGFELANKIEATISFDNIHLPVRRLEAIHGGRNEPITYWITVGDNVTLPGLGRKIHQLRYGITGKVPDGMLVRVSTIDNDASRAYKIHDMFVREMLSAISVQDRIRVAGRLLP